jgi:hypothetical protein
MNVLKLTTEKTFEAERKFWKICDYVSALLLPGEQLHNWYAGITSQNVMNNDMSDVFTASKNTYPNMDISTWKAFAVSDEEVGQEVERKLKEHGFDTGGKEPEGKIDTVYIFRKERKN